MGLKPDHWIRKMAIEQQMIEPFAEDQVRDGVISYGVSSYGYDIRVADEFKIFTNVYSAVVDPKHFDTRSMVDYKGNIFEAHHPPGESMKARGLIDIEQLRSYRHSPNSMNFIPKLRTELYTGYRKTVTPPNRFKDPMHDHAELRKLYGEVMARLEAEGAYPKPRYADD